MTLMVFAMENGRGQERNEFATEKGVWSKEWLRFLDWN